MSLELSVKGDSAAAIEELRRRFKDLRPALIAGMKSGQRKLLGAVKKNVGTSQEATQIRRTWVTGDPENVDGTITGKVFSTHPRARLREIGGLILPGKNPVHQYAPRAGQPTKALAVPIMGGRKKGGASGGDPVTYGNKLIAIYRKGKAPLLVQPMGVTKTGKPSLKGGNLFSAIRFILLRSVRIKPRPYIAPAIESTRPEIAKIFRSAITRYIQGKRP